MLGGLTRIPYIKRLDLCLARGTVLLSVSCDGEVGEGEEEDVGAADLGRLHGDPETGAGKGMQGPVGRKVPKAERTAKVWREALASPDGPGVPVLFAALSWDVSVEP